MTATSLASETGIPQQTLSRWFREAGNIKGVSFKKKKKPATTTPAPSPPPEPKRPQDWSALERAQAVLKASELPESELGEFLRREGLHRNQLEEWRTVLEEALSQHGRSARSQVDAKRIKELERDVARKDKALAETTALLILKKKMALFWGGEDDDTDPKSDE